MIAADLFRILILAIVSGAFGLLSLPAAENAARAMPLTEAGEKLYSRYTDLLKGLQSEIGRAVPVVDGPSRTAFLKAREAALSALTESKSRQKALEANQSAKGLLEHRKGWVSKAEKGIAQAQAKFKQATSDAERKMAQEELDKWEADKAKGLSELKKSQEAVEKAKIDEPRLTQENQAAQLALAKARESELNAAKIILTQLDPYLASNEWDTKLVKCALLAEATPRGLAEFAQQDKESETLVEKLLSDNSLMKQMLEANGAKSGKYGQAMRIYTDILNASPRAKEGILNKLALGTSLEHAVPVRQRNAESRKDAPVTVDPVKRYLHYEKAYLNSELDPAFKSMTAWECRMIVDSDAPDHVLEWGRNMLRNYRPDHIANPDYGWRYSGLVRTDVAYRSSSLYKDTDSLEFFQNVIKNGGICGRRAFFGRFIVKSFGLPAWGVTQHKHAALGRWTPTGWVVNLGANWQHSWYEGRSGPDFTLETQARKHSGEYQKVLRAGWVGTALGELPYNSMKEGSGGLWSVLANFKKKAIVAEAKPVELSALGQELSEANESDDAKSSAVVHTNLAETDKTIDVAPNGVITIPASACKGAQHMKSFPGGYQLFFGKGTFSCEVEVPSGGKYALAARVVTVHDSVQMQMNLNNTKDSSMTLPYTCGLWQKTEPVEVTLVQGKNVIRFLNPTKSFSLKDLTLTPVK